MTEPFDIEIGEITYSVFPEGEDIYAIFKDGVEHIKIQKDTEQHWLKLDPATEMPLFDNDVEANLIGREIDAYKE
ncbi:MAG TPA: hypothetical protein VK668_03525 [Mucilaginibacter sp.]|nr:hypothetical protein [Mucilaginibacter sp.]